VADPPRYPDSPDDSGPAGDAAGNAMLITESRVTTEHASDYLAKLCRHIERVAQSHSDARLRVERSALHGTVNFGAGTCTLDAEPTALLVRVHADNEESLQRIAGLVADRLETFGRHERLTLTWTTASPNVIS